MANQFSFCYEIHAYFSLSLHTYDVLDTDMYFKFTTVQFKFIQYRLVPCQVGYSGDARANPLAALARASEFYCAALDADRGVRGRVGLEPARHGALRHPRAYRPCRLKSDGRG